MEEMTIWEQHTVTLSKDSRVGFGFAVSGGLDKPNPVNGDAAVVVSDVIPSGPAMGRLQTRDQIVMVNGVSMENVTSLYTIQNLRNCGKTANITVKRPRTIQIPASNRPTRSASQSNILDDNGPQYKGQRGTDTTRTRRARSVTPDRNGHDLPITSGYKRLPNQDVQNKPIKTTLIKKKPTDEYGMKLGSQIFIKHMTPTGLAAKEGSLQEGDLVLKINGMTTENLSLLETKHLVEKSRGNLTMLVLRDDRKFLVSIPEVEDSPQNSSDERREDSSSELEEISDLDSDLPITNRASRRKDRKSNRNRADPVSKKLESPPLRSTLTRPAQSMPPRRVPSESESDRSNSPPPSRHDTLDHRNKVLSGYSTLPNPRASPITSSTTSRPRRAVSESDSDRSASPPPRRESPRPDNHSRYKVLPDLPPPGLKPSALSMSQDFPRRMASPYRPPPRDASESESDESARPQRRQGTPASQESRNRYRAAPEVKAGAVMEPPKWAKPSTPAQRAPSESESDGSYNSPPRQAPSPVSKSSRIKGPEMQMPITSIRQDPPLRAAPARPPPEDSSDSERAPSPLRKSDSHNSDHSFPRANGTLRSNVSIPNHTALTSKAVEEPLYVLPPDAVPTPNLGYSSDQNHISFVKEGSVGLRLVGGNDVGIFVGGVQPNSPAQKQGMTEGDQILEVNGMDFNHFTREEAAMYLMNIRGGERIDMRTQNKADIYKKILKSNLGDSFYIRTHYDHVADSSVGLSFTRGEVFRVVDTMHRGKLGSWLAVRMGNDLHELDKGTIPNQTRAETLANLEQAQRISAAERQASGPRAEFWKLRGLRGAKKSNRRTRDDLLQLTIQGKFPAYEKVLLKEANFKRPIVILGPLNDIANEKLARELPDEFEVAEMVARSGNDSSSSVIKLDTVRRIAEQDKHPLLDITPTAIERLNYIQYHPMVLFLDPLSRKDVKSMRQKYMPGSSKSSRRLYAQALKLRKNYSTLFSARIDLQPNTNMWYDVLKDKIRQQQSKPVWVSEVALEGGADEDLDAFNRANNSDYLSGASDYEDTDGEAFTDGEAYTDNEDLEEPSGGIARHRSSALARSSEPASVLNHSPEPPYNLHEEEEEEPEYTLPPSEVPPILHVPEPRSPRLVAGIPEEQEDVPSQRSFTDSDFSNDDIVQTPSDAPPNFRAPDPKDVQSKTPPLSAIEERLQQARMAEQIEPERKPSPSFIVLAHHEAMQMRRTQIRGSDSDSDENDRDEDEYDEADDIEWGPATEL
ncbi:tight junction protein ZO-3 [Danio aesculapii]|uniref:tight junction protein ZO-3 n=1 Tax=Danio aesculapii TaxID=1142201 RepID=UPI0024C093F0|nr:tight junction protein ZO-3 [Danio aesculapii]XP_056303608.1 tight junction protein ZO-3 [Danio aesculapii]XP_056303609.1 tight junction protein ZO-3 [Danio aesculapii]